ncbi:MAG: dermonecrotic toxin domain-containing protein [Pseudomonas sp.]|uniref:dermonecrotic toxin domain-containing protein n=1 Tax=Pseudomonas sp. TaxID=306 RepID=UPI00391CDA0A
MASITPPYFFDEFLHPLKRKEPTPRERALGFTLKDLEWLHTLYYATDSARQNRALHEYPMRVERLLVNPEGKPAVPLAGAFMMSPTPDAQKAVLYTPYGGLELFDSHAALLNDVTERLKQPAKRSDLLHWVSIIERDALPTAAPLTVSTAAIPGAMMADQAQLLGAGQQKNVAAMLDELRKLPSLSGMLDTLLAIMARSDFPDLNPRDTQVNYFTDAQVDETRRWMACEPLRDALLKFYVKHAWPAGQTHTFTNPAHDTAGLTQEQLEHNLQRWDSVVEQTSGILSKLLSSLVQTYWNEDMQSGQSRLQFFAQAMRDKFRADLLFKHQDRVVTGDESQSLRAVFLPDPTSRSALTGALSVEKVRIQAPFQHYVDLASTLMIGNSHAYLYTQSRGLQVLKDLKDLNATLLTMLKTAGHEDELLNFLSLEERAVLIGMDAIQVTGQPLSDDIFQEMLDDIVAKQLANLEHALGLYRRSAGGIDLAALLDSALDVRAMLDSRLLEHETGGRWTVHPIASGIGHPATVQAEKAKLHVQRLHTVEAALALERSTHPPLRGLVAHALDAELAKRQLALKAEEVYINTYASKAEEREQRTPQTSLSMVEHFIARLARQADALLDAPQTKFYGPHSEGAAFVLHNLTTQTFNAAVEQVLATFAQNNLHSLPHRLLHNNQTHLSHALLQGLRAEMALRRLDKSLPSQAVALLDSVLQANSMTRLTRHGLDGFIPDAFSLTLTLGAQPLPQPLANCFVLTERGGTDPSHSGAALLWTPRRGYEAFTSIEALRVTLAQRLQDPLARLALVENLAISKRVPHQLYALGPLQRIDEHLLHDRQQSYSEFTRAEIDPLFSMGLSATRFEGCMDRLIRRVAPSNVPRSIAIARALVNQQALPAWLGMAPPQAQILHAELLEQYRLSAPDERDYLHSITPIRAAVVSGLSTLLNARFPGEVINPDNILIPGRIDLEGNTQSLADFALSHLPELHGDAIRPRSRTALALPAALDGNAIVQLVRQLDLSSLYQQQLTARLAGQSASAHERRRLFCRQLPWQLLQYAHQQHLEERLSASAWSFVRQVFDMPDALARAAVRGTQAMIRPLELVATPGAALAKALGCYLIGPTASPSGPLVLFAPYSPQHLLCEYADESALLNEFTTAGALQAWVLGRLAAPQQATYRNLLGQHRRAGASEIRLGRSPISGNLLSQLFQDNLGVLSQMLTCQFEPAGEAQWDAVTRLFTDQIPHSLQFIAGKLTYPQVVWRSYKLFQIAAEDLQQQRWQHALKTFAGGVAELASLRTELDRLQPQTSPPEEQPSLEQWLQAPPPAAPSLDELKLTAPQRTRLQAFEYHDGALENLQHSAQTHVYRDATTTRRFVAVAGKVYSVRKAGDRWRLSQGEQHGPYVQRNTQGEWVLDLDRHHPRFGKTLSRYAGRRSTREAERQAINIEAVGMREIAALSSWKALCIDEALNVATYYTVTCKRNLLHFATLRLRDSRLGRFFSELFGVVTLTPEQVHRIERRVDEVLNELTNHTLIGPDSMRFVCGTHRQSPQDTFAFILTDDAAQKIYLLDRFFDPHMDVYQNRLNTPFNLSAHARATVLIHEITHLKSATEDLAYLDSMRPFEDLINVDIRGARMMKTDLADLRENALSLSTPVSLLFKTWDAFTQEWDDFAKPLKDKVLSTTGTRNLEDARAVFMSNSDKRIDTILANADSVTYMISQLGRELDAGA